MAEAVLVTALVLFVQLADSWLRYLPFVLIAALTVKALLLFAATLPIERRCFTTLLPDDAFFDSRPQSYYIALMPLVIGPGHFMLWVDGRPVHSWAERFSRLYLPVMFFFIYRYVPMGARTFFEHRRTMRESQMMDEQLRSLERHNRAMLDATKVK